MSVNSCSVYNIIEAMILTGSSAGELALIRRLSLTPFDTSHGQLYVAISRITNRSGLKVLLCNSDNDNCNKTKNVVFREVFRNL
ncbi:hypothetical protein ACS0TY_005098 [Phlomoides rotata]